MIVFMKNCFLLIAIASFLLGCSGNKKENTLQDEEGTPVINLSSDNVSKEAFTTIERSCCESGDCFVGGDGRISNRRNY